MNDIYEEEIICVKCAVCGDTYWDWNSGTDTICGFCTDYEPLDFDDWED